MITDEAPPEYPRPTSLPPGTTTSTYLTSEYHDDKPSISLMGIFPDAFGDVSSPPRGRAVAGSDLYDLEARRRFGVFGSRFVASERLRRSRRAEMLRDVSTTAGRVEAPLRGDASIAGCPFKRQFTKMYTVSTLGEIF